LRSATSRTRRQALLLTGLRESELATLTCHDMCAEAGREHVVVRAKPGFTPKDYEQREVPLPARLAEKLRAWPRTSGLASPLPREGRQHRKLASGRRPAWPCSRPNRDP